MRVEEFWGSFQCGVKYLCGRETLGHGSELLLSCERPLRRSGELQALCETRAEGGAQTINTRLLCLCGVLALGGEVRKENGCKINLGVNSVTEKCSHAQGDP